MQGRFLGHANPDWVWGINNRLSYRNWSLSFLFDGRVGGEIANYIQQQTFRGGRHIETVQGAMGARLVIRTIKVSNHLLSWGSFTSGTPV